MSSPGFKLSYDKTREMADHAMERVFAVLEAKIRRELEDFWNPSEEEKVFSSSMVPFTDIPTKQFVILTVSYYTESPLTGKDRWERSVRQWLT